MIRAALGLLLMSAAPCSAATGLGVPWADLPVSLNVAAARVDAAPLASNGTCDGGRQDPCRWTAPGGIEFTAQSDGAGQLERIEAAWDSDQNPGREANFQSACMAIAALVEPHWTKAQAAAAAAKTMAILDRRGSAPERQQIAGVVKLYGDRNAPAEPRTRNGAFLQCGATPNF